MPPLQSEMPSLKDSEIKQIQELIKQTSKIEEKISLGLKLKTLKAELSDNSLSGVNTSEVANIDASMPGIRPTLGSLHPITQMRQLAEDIFLNMGFRVVESVEVDTDYNHFEALNFPVGHPARDTWDTFWTKEHFLPIAHTSTMQNRVLSEYARGDKQDALRVIIPGKCFRYEATDQVHEHTFYQIEGVYVSKTASLAELIGVLSTFVETYYGYKIPYKFQPTYFPFVEPGLEMLIERTSKSGEKKWLELIPCGPIHPNVLKMAGLNSEEYKGFAWAIGLDRLVMLKYGLSDIREFHRGDLRFLRQF